MVNRDPMEDDPLDAVAAEAFRRNRERWAERLPQMAGWLAPTTPKRVEAVIAHAASHGCILDYSPTSASAVERYIQSVESDVRCYLDLDDDPWVAERVGEHVPLLIDLPALGAYFGELLVRQAGATWTTADGHDGPEPAVVGGGATAFPLSWVRWRVDSGRQRNLSELFHITVARMTAGSG